MITRLWIVVIAALLLPACATVNKGSTDYFRVDSVPQGASVSTTIETHASKRKRAGNPKLEPEYYGCDPTPCAIPFNRNAKFIARIEHEDYEPAEIFISSQNSQGSFAGNAATTTVVVGGTAYIGAAAFAGYATFASQLASGIVNALTFGLSTPASAAPATTTSSVLSSAAPPVLAISGGMLMFDAASGANKNLYPNPVILGLAPKGTETKTDPFVAIYKKELEAKTRVDKYCRIVNRNTRAREKKCRVATETERAYRTERREKMKEVFKAQKEAYKAYKAAQKAKTTEKTNP